MATASQAGSLLLGAGTLVGGIILGKVVVDAIQGGEHRAPGERSALDESIRLVASLTGISVTLLQLPAAWAQVQAIIKAQTNAPAPTPAPAPAPPLSSTPQPHIDLGPECVPGYPCSDAAEQRLIFERGLKAFLDRSRTPPGVMSIGPDPLLEQYQEASQQLSPNYRDALTEQAATIATMREGALNRRADLVSGSRGLHGPYYNVPYPGPMLWDAAWTGTPA